MPFAVNAQINAELPRSILALEGLMKNLVPSPLTRLPAAGLVISDKKTEEPFLDTMWKLRRRWRDEMFRGKEQAGGKAGGLKVWRFEGAG